MSEESLNKSTGSTNLRSWFAYPFILLIYLYRITLSPLIIVLLGHTCRFEPTCSRYAEQALRKHGALKGIGLAVRRLLKCHPWNPGGYDPVS